MKPFLRWAGSKRQHLSGLLAQISDYSGKYIEPFAGSACLFWRHAPDRAVLGDLNEALIECYQWLADDPDGVFEVYDACSNSADEYYRIRDAFNREASSLARAGYFMYLNRYCFNGLYRTDKVGRFNVPYGGERTGRLPTLEDLRGYGIKLSKTSLICADFEDIVRDHVSEGDFVYLDPPYFTSGKRVFTQYTRSPFALPDLNRLDGLLRHIDRVGAHFVVTYLNDNEIEPLAKQWISNEVDVLRRMSGFAAGRRRTNEIVFKNFQS